MHQECSERDTETTNTMACHNNKNNDDHHEKTTTMSMSRSMGSVTGTKLRDFIAIEPNSNSRRSSKAQSTSTTTNTPDRDIERQHNDHHRQQRKFVWLVVTSLLIVRCVSADTMVRVYALLYQGLHAEQRLQYEHISGIWIVWIVWLAPCVHRLVLGPLVGWLMSRYCCKSLLASSHALAFVGYMCASVMQHRVVDVCGMGVVQGVALAMAEWPTMRLVDANCWRYRRHVHVALLAAPGVGALALAPIVEFVMHAKRVGGALVLFQTLHLLAMVIVILMLHEQTFHSRQHPSQMIGRPYDIYGHNASVSRMLATKLTAIATTNSRLHCSPDNVGSVNNGNTETNDTTLTQCESIEESLRRLASSASETIRSAFRRAAPSLKCIVQAFNQTDMYPHCSPYPGVRQGAPPGYRQRRHTTSTQPPQSRMCTVSSTHKRRHARVSVIGHGYGGVTDSNQPSKSTNNTGPDADSQQTTQQGHNTKDYYSKDTRSVSQPRGFNSETIRSTDFERVRMELELEFRFAASQATRQALPGKSPWPQSGSIADLPLVRNASDQSSQSRHKSSSHHHRRRQHHNHHHNQSAARSHTANNNNKQISSEPNKPIDTPFKSSPLPIPECDPLDSNNNSSIKTPKNIADVEDESPDVSSDDNEDSCSTNLSDTSATSVLQQVYLLLQKPLFHTLWCVFACVVIVNQLIGMLAADVAQSKGLMTSASQSMIQVCQAGHLFGLLVLGTCTLYVLRRTQLCARLVVVTLGLALVSGSLYCVTLIKPLDTDEEIIDSNSRVMMFNTQLSWCLFVITCICSTLHSILFSCMTFDNFTNNKHNSANNRDNKSTDDSTSDTSDSSFQTMTISVAQSDDNPECQQTSTSSSLSHAQSMSAHSVTIVYGLVSFLSGTIMLSVPRLIDLSMLYCDIKQQSECTRQIDNYDGNTDNSNHNEGQILGRLSVPFPSPDVMFDTNQLVAHRRRNYDQLFLYLSQITFAISCICLIAMFVHKIVQYVRKRWRNWNLSDEQQDILDIDTSHDTMRPESKLSNKIVHTPVTIT